MISRAIHGKMLFQLTRNKGIERGSLDVFVESCRRSARFAPAHFSSPAGRSCSSHRSGTTICRRRALHFPPHRGSQRRTNRLNACRPDGAVPLQEQHRSFHFLSVKCNLDLFALLLHVFTWFCTCRTSLSGKCFVRDDAVLIFHPFDHWPES